MYITDTTVRRCSVPFANILMINYGCTCNTLWMALTGSDKRSFLKFLDPYSAVDQHEI